MCTLSVLYILRDLRENLRDLRENTLRENMPQENTLQKYYPDPRFDQNTGQALFT